MIRKMTSKKPSGSWNAPNGVGMSGLPWRTLAGAYGNYERPLNFNALWK